MRYHYRQVRDMTLRVWFTYCMEKILPDMQRLEELRDRGLTHRQMAEWIEQHMGAKVAPTSIAAAFSRAGKTNGRARYEKHLPWKVQTPHIKHYAARMLRLLGRRDAGMELSDLDDKRLDAWLHKLRSEHAVVAYVPDSDEGFYYVDGSPGKDGIPILKPAAVKQ